MPFEAARDLSSPPTDLSSSALRFTMESVESSNAASRGSGPSRLRRRSVHEFSSKLSRSAGVCSTYVAVASASSMANGNSSWLSMDSSAACGVKGDPGAASSLAPLMRRAKLETPPGECGYTPMTSRIDVPRLELGDQEERGTLRGCANAAPPGLGIGDSGHTKPPQGEGEPCGAGPERPSFGARTRGEHAMGAAVVGEKPIVVIGEAGAGGGGGCATAIEGLGAPMSFAPGGLATKSSLSMDVPTSIFKHDAIVERLGGGRGGSTNGDSIALCSACFAPTGAALNPYIGAGPLFGAELGALSNR